MPNHHNHEAANEDNRIQTPLTSQINGVCEETRFEPLHTLRTLGEPLTLPS